MNNESSRKLCAEEGLKMLGDFWILSIIQQLSLGEKRFSQLERDLPSINPATLTTRLKRLEAQDMIQRQEKTASQQSVVYSLTEKGRGVLPILEQIVLFGEKFGDGHSAIETVASADE